jgi:hypothetical protein
VCSDGGGDAQRQPEIAARDVGKHSGSMKVVEKMAMTGFLAAHHTSPKASWNMGWKQSPKMMRYAIADP